MRRAVILGVAGLLMAGALPAAAQSRPRVSVDIRYEWSNWGHRHYGRPWHDSRPRHHAPVCGPVYVRPPPPPRGYWTTRYERVWIHGTPGYYETRFGPCGRRYQVWIPGSPGYWASHPVRVWVPG